MSEGTKAFLKSAWNKISLGTLKAFRGLICEKKDGGWELSLGRVSFWVVFSHCMYVWNSGAHAAKAVVGTAIDAASAVGEAAVDATSAVGTSAIDTIANTAGALSASSGVPEQEFYLLLTLIGYSAIKVTKGGVTNAISAIRGNGSGGQ